MLNPTIRFRSASASQLEDAGTAFTGKLLGLAVETLADDDLLALEEELEFCDRTGLIGLRMSKLLATLRMDALAVAA